SAGATSSTGAPSRRATNAAPSTTQPNATKRSAPSIPGGAVSWKIRSPAAIGRAFVQNDDNPAVARARPRWNESWIRLNAIRWHAQRARAKARAALAGPASSVRTPAPAYTSPAPIPTPAPGARRGAGGPIETPPRTNETRTHAATATQEPVELPLDPPASETE